MEREMSLSEEGQKITAMLVNAVDGHEGTALGLAVGIGEFYLRSLIAMQQAGCPTDTIKGMISIVGEAHEIAQKWDLDSDETPGTLQ